MRQLLTTLFFFLSLSVLGGDLEVNIPKSLSEYQRLEISYPQPSIDLTGYYDVVTVELNGPEHKWRFGSGNHPPRRTTWEKLRPWTIIAWHVSSIAVGAIGDGYYDEGKMIGDQSKIRWGKRLQAAEIGMVMSGPFVLGIPRDSWMHYLGSYIAFRFTTFDYFYNASRGLPLGHIGTVSTYDDIVNEIPPHGLVFSRAVSLVVGWGFIINYW